MVRSRIALFLAAVGLVAGSLVGCGSGPEPKEDGEGGEPAMERTSPDEEGRMERQEGEDGGQGDDDGGDDDGGDDDREDDEDS